MGSKADAWEVDILKLVTGQATTMVTSTPMGTVPIKLYTVAPTDATAGTEVTGGSYASVDSKGKWGTPAAGSVANSAIITFPTATADWSAGANIVAFAVCNAAGTQTMWGALTTPKAVLNGDTPSFAIGALVLTED